MPDRAKDGKLDRIVAEARRAREQRARSYRERALKILPWICGRCAREFTHTNVQLLTVHHKDGNHDNNPNDGSNWELLCNYCHENEHSRHLEHAARGEAETPDRQSEPSSYKPFAGLDKLLKTKKPE